MFNFSDYLIVLRRDCFVPRNDGGENVSKRAPACQGARPGVWPPALAAISLT